MKTLVWGNIIFAAALLAHILVWKISLPKRQAKTLALLLAAVCAAGLLFLFLWPGLPFRPSTGSEFAHLVLYLAALGLAYLITYSAVEVDSPSLVLIQRVAQAGGRGLSYEELASGLTEHTLVKPRIDDLVTDKMAVLDGGIYRLTPKGASLALLFWNFRKLLGAGKGG